MNLPHSMDIHRVHPYLRCDQENMETNQPKDLDSTTRFT